MLSILLAIINSLTLSVSSLVISVVVVNAGGILSIEIFLFRSRGNLPPLATRDTLYRLPSTFLPLFPS
jgi:hypothetical protein